MTTTISNSTQKKQSLIRRHLFIIRIFFFVGCASNITGQDTIPPAEENEGFKSRMSLTANQFSDGHIELDGLLRVKMEESYQAVPAVKVGFFNVTPDGEEKSLGEVVTGTSGKAVMDVQDSALTADADGYYSFIVRFDGNDKLKSSESDLRIHPAKLVAETVEDDSTLLIKLHATAESLEGPVPIVEATVAVYVKRMYTSLKVGEGTTDEEGNVEIEFPDNLPGDKDSNLLITAMIEESDEYGNVAVSMTKPWGNALVQDAKEFPRALWSPHPPTWMVVTFFILMVTVWGNYVIIVYKLFRIRFKKIDAHA